MRCCSVDLPLACQGFRYCLTAFSNRSPWMNWQSCCSMPLSGKQVASKSPGNSCSSNVLSTPSAGVKESSVTHTVPLYSDNNNNNLKCVFLSTSWCRLRHHRKVKGVNVVIVEDLTQNHFYKHYLCLQHLRTSYTSVRGKINTANQIIYEWSHICSTLAKKINKSYFFLEGHLHAIICRCSIWNLFQSSSQTGWFVCLQTRWGTAGRWESCDGWWIHLVVLLLLSFLINIHHIIIL